jgi:aryl-alcohol dehydrogenase-like predicted oxidoreductase
MYEGARADLGPLSRFLGAETRLGFGAWAVGGAGWGAAEDERQRAAAIRHALERGVTFFDTAPSYGAGESERLLGRALKADRARVAIATKVGPRDDPRASLEASLRRLDSDYVDVVQLHEPLERWEWRLEKLHTLQVERKALALGLCNATHLQLERALTIAPLATYQAGYNLFDRDVEERELPLCRNRGLGFLAYRPLAAGLLTGKYAAPPQFAEGDHRRQIYWFKGREFERRRCVIDRLLPMAQREGLSLIGLALGWLRARPGVSIVLAGARNAAQVDQVFAPDPRPLAPDVGRAIDAIVADVFRPARSTPQLAEAARTWGERERFIAARLDGKTRYEAIAAAWTDRGEQPMIAAQVKVFVDQLVEQGLAELTAES